jgi:hypothetical protein
MAHPETEAGDVRAPATVADAAADFENFLFGEGDEPEEQEQETNPEGEPEEGDEPDADDLDGEEQDDEGGEPETAIDAPVSLNAEEKAAFAAASPEAQRAWAAAETRRNTQVQEATTKASNAQREAEARAASADAEARKVYATQLREFAKALEPQAPPPQLAQTNPQAYIAQEAQYRAAKAQHDEFVQQVEAVDREADQDAQTAFLQARDRELMQIPEVANPETRDGYFKTAFSVAETLGYDTAELASGMSARDVKALALVASLKEKADKYDKAMAAKMQRVRSGKVRSNKPGASPHANARANPAKSWERVKGAGSKESQAAAFADWMGLEA